MNQAYRNPEKWLKLLKDSLEGKFVKITNKNGISWYYKFSKIKEIECNYESGKTWMHVASNEGNLILEAYPYIGLALEKTNKYIDGGDTYELSDEKPEESKIKPNILIKDNIIYSPMICPVKKMCHLCELDCKDTQVCKLFGDCSYFVKL